MRPNQTSILTLASLVAATLCPQAQAFEQIIRPYQSIRSSSMGGLKVTTGLYDENFHGNPARALANPKTRIALIDPMVEVNSTTLSNVPTLLEDTENLVGNLADNPGDNYHGRFQFTFPSVYIAPRAATDTQPAGKLALAFGVVNSVQFDGAVLSSGDPNIDFVADGTVNATVAHKFLDDESLGVGLNARYHYRAAGKQGYGLLDILQRDTYGVSGGGKVDFDLGATYVLPVDVLQDTRLEVGAVISNLIEGEFTSSALDTAINQIPPIAPRTFGFGISAQRASLWKFTNVIAALEFQDIGNNSGGSLFRTVHLGMEARYGILAPRIGFNQGYLSGGLGILTRYVTLELATYGEEMRLNVGDQQDRRYAVRLAFQIE
jgi:hypothetical protein